MAQTVAALDSLTDLLDASSRPIYAVDARRRIVYCNSALAAWLDLQPARIVGRLVEYHSQPAAGGGSRADELAPLADLCPPPRALTGEPCVATISCLARGGGLVHRRAEFVPLGMANLREADSRSQSGVLAFLASRDLTPQELASELSGESSADELHRTIRQFRRAQAVRYAVESLLGESTAMRKLRAQVAAAAASGANTLICGPAGGGRAHVARAIHYSAVGDANVKLVPVDCEVASDDLLRRALDAVRATDPAAHHRPTLLLENLDRLPSSQQAQLSSLISQNLFSARIIATCSRHTRCAVADAESNVEPSKADDPADGTRSVPATLDLALFDAISTITIYVPRLADRLEDLPILAQFFLEAANRASGKQVGSVRADALDLLAFHSWPDELDELRQVIAAAHRACSSHEITPANLPAIIHHASKTAACVRRQPERIVLDELLANIENEAIVRALAQARGNKTEAAELLGMTRPRLYRRLLQLGLAGPEFIEHDSIDEAP
ncbi:MAG: helix-turn-helix domain-containing protein [Pirellulales bacterium]